MAGALRRGDTARVTEFLISFQRPPGLLAVELRAWLGSHARRFDAISGSLSCRADATPVSSTDALLLSICRHGETATATHASIAELVADMRLLGLRPLVLGDREAPVPDFVATHA